MLTGPGDELRDNLSRRFAASDWDGVLALTEGAMETSCGRAWLDLQRHTVKALEGKGPYFAFVADAVRSGVRGLLQDLPGLLHVTLRDGSPAADEATREWIGNEVMAGTVASFQAPAPAAVAAPAADPVIEPTKTQLPPIELSTKPPELEGESLSNGISGDVFDQALHAAEEGRLPEALKLLNGQLSSERSGRGRFKRRVQLAHLLVAAGHKRVAQPVLEEVAQEIEKRRLEDWEDGEALAYPLGLLLRCVESNAEERLRLYAALCRLDPVRALQIEI
jgi:type VI secretion system ImpA/VasJ family protein